MLYGFDILYFVAVALLKYNEGEFFYAKIHFYCYPELNFIFILLAILLSSDFDRALTMLSSSIKVTDDDKLTKKIRKMYNKKGTQKLIVNFKEEYRNQSHLSI